MKGLDYRFDMAGSQLNSFIDGDFRDLTDLSGQLNYHVTNNFMVFGAIDYKKDSGHAYWGTPLVPTVVCRIARRQWRRLGQRRSARSPATI